MSHQDEQPVRKDKNLTDAEGRNKGYISTKTYPDKMHKASTYVHKLLKNDDDPFIAIFEAILGDCYRLISTNLTPRIRIIRDPATQKITAVVSKQIHEFKPACDMNAVEWQNTFKNKKKYLATLLVSAYVLAENDLHDDNWGIDSNGYIIKIDNGQTLCDFTASYFGIQNHSTKPSILKKWPNRIFSKRSAFALIDSADIINFPNIQAQKPSNWPVRDFPELSGLVNDQDFKIAKYYYFTKSLLLGEEQILNIAWSYSTEEYTEQATELAAHLTKRLQKIRSCLINIAEYREYLITNFSKIQQHIVESMDKYNRQFYDNNGSIKPQYQHRLIRPDYIDSVLDTLLHECQNFNDYDFDVNLFRSREIIDLMWKETFALHRLQNAHSSLQLRKPIINDLINEKLTYIASIEHELTKLNASLLPEYKFYKQQINLAYQGISLIETLRKQCVLDFTRSAAGEDKISNVDDFVQDLLSERWQPEMLDESLGLYVARWRNLE